MLSSDALALLPGQPVIDRDGEKIGKVLDVYTPDAGAESFASVSSTILGLKACLVPLQRASLDGSDLRVPYTKDEVRGAPRIEVDEVLAAAETVELLRYYREIDAATDRQQPAAGSSSGQPSSGQPASGQPAPTSVVTVAVTATNEPDATISDDQAAVLNDAVAEVVEELVDKARAELDSDPALTTATATVEVELTDDAVPDAQAT